MVNRRKRADPGLQKKTPLESLERSLLGKRNLDGERDKMRSWVNRRDGATSGVEKKGKSGKMIPPLYRNRPWKEVRAEIKKKGDDQKNSKRNKPNGRPVHLTRAPGRGPCRTVTVEQWTRIHAKLALQAGRKGGRKWPYRRGIQSGQGIRTSTTGGGLGIK